MAVCTRLGVAGRRGQSCRVRRAARLCVASVKRLFFLREQFCRTIDQALATPGKKREVVVITVIYIYIIKLRAKLPCYGLSTALALVSSSSSQL